jgi:REP element-mobilizing transposase RayT
MEQDLPQRRNTRVKWHDYSDGIFFITICTKDNVKYFGSIRNEEMRLSKIGEYVKVQIDEISKHTPTAKVGLYVIMPNHIHLMIGIWSNDYRMPSSKIGGYHSILANVIGGLKAAVKRYTNNNNIQFEWQPRYYEHIVRNDIDYKNIYNYIGMNIVKWSDDKYHV